MGLSTSSKGVSVTALIGSVEMSSKRRVFFGSTKFMGPSFSGLFNGDVTTP